MSKGTEATLATVEYFLNYAVSNPDSRIRFIASEMILQTISDAAYLVCPNARSRMGGVESLSSTDGFRFVFIKVEVAFCGSHVTRGSGKL